MSLSARISRCKTQIPINLVFLKVFGINVGKINGNISCPFTKFHDRGDIKPSCKIYETTCHCFTENKSRDVVSIIKDYFDVSLPIAIQYLEDNFLDSSINVIINNLNKLGNKKHKHDTFKLYLKIQIPMLKLNNKIKKSIGHTNMSYLYNVLDYILEVGDSSNFKNFQDIVEWYNWAFNLYKLEAKLFLMNLKENNK